MIHGDHKSGRTENEALPGERVPLIFCHPQLLTSRNEGLVSHIDISPMIADLLGKKPDSGWLGRNVFSESEAPEIVLPNGKAIVNGTAEFNDAALRIVDYSKAMLGR
ncbi:MAG: hypothetical protein ACKVJU_21635 [Verrucomicrobiales bacterium]